MTLFARLFRRWSAPGNATLPSGSSSGVADSQALAVALANAGLGASRSKDAAGQPSGRATRLTKGLTPEIMATYLDEFYEGRFRNIAMLWDAMQDGDTVCAPVAEKRLSKIVGELRNFTIEALAETPAAQRQADFLRDLLSDRVRAEHALRPAEHGGLRKAVECVCDAVGKKYSFLAKTWEGKGDKLQLRLRHVPLWHFREEDDGSYLYLPNPDSTANATPVREDQWVVAVRRRAVMQAASLAVLFRRLPVQQIARALEKFGVPNVIGTTTSEPNSPGWQAMSNALYSYLSDMPVLMSEGNRIEVRESDFRAASLHRTHLEWCTTEIIINWLGGELGTVGKSGTGTLAGNAQASDLDDLIRDDCDWLTELVNEQIVQDAIAHRFPKQPVLARFILRKPDETDDHADMELIERAVQLGATIPTDYLYERFSLPCASAEETCLGGVERTDPTDPEPEETPDGTPPPPTGGRGGPDDGTAEDARPASPHANAIDQSAPPSVPSLTPPRPPAATEPPARTLLPQASTDRDRLTRLADEVLPAVHAACMELAQPIRLQLEQAADASDAYRLARQYQLSAEALDALAETMARAIFRAAMLGLEPALLTLPAVAATDTEPSLAIPPELTDPDRLVELREQARQAGQRIAVRAGEAVLRRGRELTARARAEGGDVPAPVWAELKGQAETIVRSNLYAAFCWARWQQLRSMSEQDQFVLMADVIEDGRTSGVCVALAGIARAVDDALWDTWFPPNHPNCRTLVYPVPAEDAREACACEVDGALPLPSPSYRRNVGKGPLADIVPVGPEDAPWARRHLAARAAISNHSA